MTNVKLPEVLLTPKEAAAFLKLSLSWLAKSRLRCHSACNFGSDSVLMQLQIRMALFWRESAPCNRHFAAPVWCRPGLL